MIAESFRCSGGGPSATRREESLYLQAALRLAVKDPGAGSAARQLLETFPASPLSAEIGIRLDTRRSSQEHGRRRRPVPCGCGNGGPGGFRRGKIHAGPAPVPGQGCRRHGPELSPPLSDPSFLAGPVAFEQEVMALSVLAWESCLRKDWRRTRR